MAISLKSLRKGKHAAPPRMVVYGAHGLGKSTFASQAPDVVFIATEDGLAGIDTTSFPLAKTFQDALDAIAALYNEDHAYKTVCVDSLDWLESLIWKHVAKENAAETIDSISYGRGFAEAADHFRDVLDGLNALRLQRGMGIICTAHTEIKRYDDPASEPYDRFCLRLHKRVAPVVMEWADIVGFVSQEMVVRSEDVGFGRKVKRGVATGGHVLHLKRSPAWDAKNRFGLPDSLPLSWSAFAEAFAAANQPTTETNKEKKNG